MRKLEGFVVPGEHWYEVHKLKQKVEKPVPSLHCPKDRSCKHEIYDTCMFCNGAIFGPARWAFSHGLVPCASCKKSIRYLDLHKDTKGDN